MFDIKEIYNEICNIYPTAKQTSVSKRQTDIHEIVIQFMHRPEIHYIVYFNQGPTCIEKKCYQKQVKAFHGSKWVCVPMSNQELEVFDKLGLVLTSSQEYNTGQNLEDWF